MVMMGDAFVSGSLPLGADFRADDRVGDARQYVSRAAAARAVSNVPRTRS